jgi:hypothetical protein
MAIAIGVVERAAYHQTADTNLIIFHVWLSTIGPGLTLGLQLMTHEEDWVQ